MIFVHGNSGEMQLNIEKVTPRTRDSLMRDGATHIKRAKIAKSWSKKFDANFARFARFARATHGHALSRVRKDCNLGSKKRGARVALRNCP